ncbi:MAG: alpha/beta hydrolase [Bacteroidetes bacterium B1(2017)]|nr:MAG: alpha/beta hydrolase [Bacteroidetes bacterium B1(2017)]
MEKILFLHGALGSKLQFSPLINALGDSFECHSLNFAGHSGELIPAQGLTFQTFAQNILDYLNANKIDKINLFGFSMGGYAALYFAHLHPERVVKIMTLNVKFNWDPITTAKETGMLDPDKMFEKVPQFANNLMVLHGMNIWKNLLKSTSDMMKKLAETVVMSEEQLKSIQHPVLLGIGDRDTTSSISETLTVYQMMPQAQFWVLPATAHPFERVSTAQLELMIKSYF